MGSRDLELHWALGLVLHHDGAARHRIAMANISHLERYEVTATQLAVDAKVEERQFADPAFHLKANSKSLDVLDFERGLLTDHLALVPRFVRLRVGC